MNYWKYLVLTLSRFTQKWILPPACLDHGLYGHKSQSFPLNRAPKMPESQQLCFEFRIVSRIFQHPAIQNKKMKRIFSANKCAPANRKKGSYTNHDPNKQEVGFIFVWSGSELWSIFIYSKLKLKNQKPVAVDVLFKAYPMVPLLCRSNLAGRYL